MDIKEVQLNQDETERMSSIDSSIQHKSVTAISLQLQADAMKSQVRELYEFRRKFIDSKLGNEGVDLSRVVQVSLVPDNDLAKIVVALKPSENGTSTT